MIALNLAHKELILNAAVVMREMISSVCNLRPEGFPADQVWQLSRPSQRDQNALYLLDRIPAHLEAGDREQVYHILGFVQAHMLFRGMVGSLSDFEDELDHKLREMEGGSDDQG